MHYLILKADKLIANAPVILCEGFATGASLFDAFHRPVLVAFDAGNLLEVAKAYRARYPHNQIDLCADNDRSKAINTGVNAANAVAAAIQVLFTSSRMVFILLVLAKMGRHYLRKESVHCSRY